MLKREFFRQWVASLFICLLVVLPFRYADGRLETAEQAQGDQKLFAQEREMVKQADKPGANDQPTVLRLGSIKIDNIRWQNIGVQSALADLKVKSEAADPNHVGFDYVLHLPADMSQTDCLGRVINNNVCIILTSKTSVLNLLYSISEQTNLSFQVQKGKITMKLWKSGAYISVSNRIR